MAIQEKFIRENIKHAILHIKKYGVTDVDLIGDPFEVILLREMDDKEIEQLTDSILRRVKTALPQKAGLDPNVSGLKLQPLRHVLIPKKTLADFRKCAVTDIIDEIIYLSIVLCIATKIEKARISASGNQVFSYRFQRQAQKNSDTSSVKRQGKVNGKNSAVGSSGSAFNLPLFRAEYHFNSFLSEVKRQEGKEKVNIIVECDIASFYDRLNLHRLNSILLGIDGVDPDIAMLLDGMLLYWAGRDSYGLPVGSNASRILAEASLIEVDLALLRKGVKFARFVDDYRIFCETAEEANLALLVLVRALEREGLFLNSAKTEVRDVSGMRHDEERSDDEVLQRSQGSLMVAANGVRAKDEQTTLPKSGYAGLIPLKYREPSVQEDEELLLVDLNGLIETCFEETILSEADFHTLCKVLIAQDQLEFLPSVLELVGKCPQFIPYLVDLMIKHDNSMKSDVKEIVKRSFECYLDDDDVADYIVLALIRFFASEGFRDDSTLMRGYRSLQRGKGGVLGRAYLTAMAGSLQRADVLDIRDESSNLALFEVRAVAFVVSERLHKTEARPFLKNLLIQYDDFFLERIKP